MFEKTISFLKESKSEFKRVNWPTRKETTHLTLIVVGMSLAVAATLGLFDFLFVYILETYLI